MVGGGRAAAVALLARPHLRVRPMRARPILDRTRSRPRQPARGRSHCGPAPQRRVPLCCDGAPTLQPVYPCCCVVRRGAGPPPLTMALCHAAPAARGPRLPGPRRGRRRSCTGSGPAAGAATPSGCCCPCSACSPDPSRGAGVGLGRTPGERLSRHVAQGRRAGGDGKGVLRCPSGGRAPLTLMLHSPVGTGTPLPPRRRSCVSPPCTCLQPRPRPRSSVLRPAKGGGRR